MPSVARRISSSISRPSECGGSTQALSPEWTPASSTCCMIPPIQTASPSQSASTSTSIAFSRKRSRKISRARPLPVARAGSRAGRRSSRRSPSRGRRGRSSAARAAGSRPPRWPRSRPRPSAPSPTAGHAARAGPAGRRSARGPRPGRSRRREVPSTGTPASCSPAASLSGVWPPNWTMTPSGCSTSHDGEDVLERQRLEVQAVGGVVVGGDRLRVAVDHHRVAAGRADGHRRVDAAVVELDALADAVGSGAEDHHRRAVAAPHLVARGAAALPARVEVRRAGRRTPRRTCRPSGTTRSPRKGSSGSSASDCSSRRNHGSIDVRAWTSAGVAPRRNASCRTS